jgi:hypothetical protein
VTDLALPTQRPPKVRGTSDVIVTTQQFLSVKSFLSNQIVAKPKQRKMKPRGKESSIPDANTVFEGQEIRNRDSTRVEAGSNTSTVTLRVVGGDEMGSLKSETLKYGRESKGARTGD